MMSNVADGVWVHQSELLQNNTVVIRGEDGALVIDPGITDSELACLAADLAELELPAVVGFSTHPDWDHVLWHPDLGDVPRWGTAAGGAFIREVVSHDDWRATVREGLPPEIVDEMSLDGFGLITGLPHGASEIPWNGPRVRIIEHPAHAVGHAALVVEGRGVLVAGDMVSDILMPFPDFSVADPIGDYLTGLRMLESAVDDVDVVVPGHGSVGDRAQLRARIALDRAYVEALRDGTVPDDIRITPEAPYGGDWLPDLYAWQAQMMAGRTAD